MDSFPQIQKSISNYLYEEEGNITRNQLLMVGSMAVIMSVLFVLDADAGHSSHRSHSSHSSHSSGYSSHSSHVSHTSHTSSAGHSSHSSGGHSSHSSSSHSNHSNHSNVMPKVLTPQKIGTSSLPQSVELSNIPIMPESPPDTVTPAFGVAAVATVESSK